MLQDGVTEEYMMSNDKLMMDDAASFERALKLKKVGQSGPVRGQ